MSYRTDKFEVGDSVTWADDYYANMLDSRKTYGDGPFKIQEVFNREHFGHDSWGERPRSNYDSMGHTQHVIVSDTKKTGYWSGAFFKKVEE